MSDPTNGTSGYWEDLIDSQISSLEYIDTLYKVIEEMQNGFMITTESGGELYIGATDAGLDPWIELARGYVDDRMVIAGRILVAARRKKLGLAEE
jgi:hypothetical protein